MKKAKITLSAIAALSALGSVLAFKAAKRGANIYFIGSIYNTTPTATLTRACTVPPGRGEYVYYTLLKTAKVTNYSFVSQNN